jgi:hypothetical protein
MFLNQRIWIERTRWIRTIFDSKCDSSIRRNMRYSLELEFHKGVTLTAGEKSGSLFPPSTHNVVLIYKETVNEDADTKRGRITNDDHIPNWLSTGLEVLR